MEETKVVVRATPFQLTVESALKLVPTAVKAKLDIETVTAVGEIEARVGTGLIAPPEVIVAVPVPPITKVVAKLVYV